VALNNTLCAMLRSSPFHRENYARLIMGVIIQFYQRCYERFQLLVSVQGSSEESPAFVLAAQWAQLGNLAPCLAEMFTIPVCRWSLSLGLMLTDADTGACYGQDGGTVPARDTARADHTCTRSHPADGRD
jgi:hypothetical protein